MHLVVQKICGQRMMLKHLEEQTIHIHISSQSKSYVQGILLLLAFSIRGAPICID